LNIKEGRDVGFFLCFYSQLLLFLFQGTGWYVQLHPPNSCSPSSRDAHRSHCRSHFFVSFQVSSIESYDTQLCFKPLRLINCLSFSRLLQCVLPSLHVFFWLWPLHPPLPRRSLLHLCVVAMTTLRDPTRLDQPRVINTVDSN
jgi:hypothetical protein